MVATVVLCGCGGSNDTYTTTTITTQTTGGGSQNPITGNNVRTFNLSNSGSSAYALVSSSVGSSDYDLSKYSASVAMSSAVPRQAPTQRAQSSSPSLTRRHLVLHREAAQTFKQARGFSKAQVVNYDNSPTLSFYIALTNQTVTLYNRTPGVGANPGTRPNTIVTYVEQAGGADVINATDLQNAINAWETSNPFGALGNTGIYNTCHQIFGQEWNAGGGNDGDTRVVCCFLSTATIGGPGLFGYVDLTDELAPRGQSYHGNPSNGGEILYVQGQASSVSQYFQGDGFDGYATLAHELEHLIIFNNKFAQQGAFPSSASMDFTSVDEGLATLAEEVNGFGLTASGGGNSFIFDIIQSYQTTSPTNNNFLSFTASGADYGKGYLFFKYIQDTMGIDTITAISLDTDTGTSNIAKHVGRSFASQQQAWTLANYISGFSSGGAPYRYASLNMTGTYSLHTNNDPNQATLETLPGMQTGQTLVGGTTLTETLIALAQNYITVLAGTGSGTITVTYPSNIQTSLVQVQNGAVVNVSF